MNRLRLVLISRRFWPSIGSAERAIENLAVELASRGHEVTVLTARACPRWPERIDLRGVSVVRLPYAGWRLLRPWRFARRLAGWLRQHRGSFDLVIVSSLAEEAAAAVQAVGHDVPVVLRAERSGRAGDCFRQIETASGRRIKAECMKAAGFVAPTPLAQRELQAAGYPRDRIRLVPNGVPIPPPADAAARIEARRALGEANPVLLMPEGVPLAVFAGRLEADRGLPQLIAAWPRVLRRHGDARLWLAGEGPDAAALRRQIARLGVAHRLVLPGLFDRIDGLLVAADQVVLPPRDSGTSLALVEAMAAGLPLVAADTAESRALVENGREGLLVAAENPAALPAAIVRLLDDPALAGQLAAAARHRAIDQYTVAQMADGHVG